jgi:ATP-dependent Lon protease
MEVIRIPGYTPEEKLEIARSFLIPRQLEANGLPEDRVHWSEAAVLKIVTDYTFEAGVRNLERQVASICRKVARRAAEGDETTVRVHQRTLESYLGPSVHAIEKPAAKGEVGVANGLAWTEAGGDVLRLEAAMTKGRGLVLTGQLGDVMKESGQAALTFARWRLADFGIDERLLSCHQVHVHVPAGAIPKDGPSAGVTIAVALASLATGIPVRPDVAMTGEVTLRGRVLPVGGIREKVLAALRSGISTVILPERSMAELKEIPGEIAKKIDFIGVSHMDQVLKAALERMPTRGKSRVRTTPAASRRSGVAAAKSSD